MQARVRVHANARISNMHALLVDVPVCMLMCALACLCVRLRASVRVCMLRHVRSLTHARFCARQHANALIGMLMRAFAC